MKNSSRDNRFRGARGGRKFQETASGKRSFGSRGENRRFRDRDSGRRLILHKAICSECGKECELPFKPTGEKPVFCNNCFRDKGNSSGFSGRGSKKYNFQEKRMYSAICVECGNKCEVPFRPTDGKPIYCSNCFRKSDNTGEKNTEHFKEQFEILNVKLDNILKLLTPIASTEVVTEQKATRKTRALKSKKVATKQTKKTASPKKTFKKKAAAKKTVAQKATRKKKN